MNDGDMVADTYGVVTPKRSLGEGGKIKKNKKRRVLRKGG